MEWHASFEPENQNTNACLIYANDFLNMNFRLIPFVQC